MASLTKVFKSFFLFLLVSAFVLGCSGLEQSEQEKLRRMNAKGEFVLRTQDESAYALTTPAQRVRERYPWETVYSGQFPKISKEFFRCRGSSVNPPHADHKDPTRPVNYFDCGGFQKHSLPMKGDKEFVYPILIDLLNYIQEKTRAKVVITCGHRCPVHNAYADSSTYNQNSKHMIGAEVDFYVQGWESRSEEVIQIVMQYYQDNASIYRDKKSQEFLRLETGKLNVSTPPWYNKEILIKLYKKTEGRDFDNRHPYPYISLQVRHDKEINEQVICSWERAFHCFRRY
jgi:hypothetical protein